MNEEQNVKWLDHLEEAVPPEGYGNRLSIYLISLEAWRRGISVKFSQRSNLQNKVLVQLTLSHGNDNHIFEGSEGDKLSPEAFDVCKFKDLTKKYLRDAGITVAQGRVFNDSNSIYEIIAYVKFLGFPVVAKPLDERAGKGVFANISNEENLKDIVEYMREELKVNAILIEEYIYGREFRMLTIGGKFKAAAMRMPANITGNGKDNIGKLINKKNEERKSNPNLSSKKISIDREVKQLIEDAGYTLESVLECGEQLFLRSKSNVSAGGDPIDVTDDIPEKIKEIAEKASQTIPGLDIAGLDFIINPDSGSATIIEINTKPMLGVHVFPVKGLARDIPKEIIDLYFPETKYNEKSNLYFDFKSAISTLYNGAISEVQLDNPPYFNVSCSIKVQIQVEPAPINFLNQIRLIALRLEINGYIKKLKKNIYEVIAASGNNNKIIEFQTKVNELSTELNIKRVTVEDWDKPVEVGFNIKKDEITPIKSQLKTTKKKLNLSEEKIEKLLNHKKTLNEKNISLTEKNHLLQEELQSTTTLYNSLKTLSKYNLRKLKAYQKKLNSQNEKIKEIEYELDNLRKSYYEILNSKSWKITKPLREYNFFNKNNKKS